jgi:hypothetical protein
MRNMDGCREYVRMRVLPHPEGFTQIVYKEQPIIPLNSITIQSIPTRRSSHIVNRLFTSRTDCIQTFHSLDPIAC